MIHKEQYEFDFNTVQFLVVCKYVLQYFCPLLHIPLYLLTLHNVLHVIVLPQTAAHCYYTGGDHNSNQY